MIKIQNKDLAKKHLDALKDKICFQKIKITELYKTSSIHKKFISYLENNFENIIVSKPDKLRVYIREVSNYNILLIKHKSIKNKKFTNQENNENEFINALIEIFNYDKKIMKVNFAKNIGLISCPYCNREYIFKFYDKTNRELRTIAHLDHFYSQKNYPFLALSFYNLIPSCSICNSKFKHTKNFYEIKHLHPYEDDFNKRAKFTHFFNNQNEDNKHYSIFSKERISLDLKAIDNEDIKTKNTIKTFRLNELYNEHKDIVLELIQKNEIYNESYLDELMGNYEGTLFKNREDLLRLVTCGYVADEDINKRPLSKLIKDISNELDLI